MTTTGRSGYTDYADLLRMVVDEPGTTADLAERFGVSPRRMRPTMAVMCGAGLVQVAMGGRAPVWSFDGAGCPLPSLADMAGSGQHVVRFCRLTVALIHGPAMKAPELQEASGIDPNILRELLRHLCERARLAYVADWRRAKARGGNWMPYFSFGIDKTSAPHPHKCTRDTFTELMFTTAGRQWPLRSTTNEERTS